MADLPGHIFLWTMNEKIKDAFAVIPISEMSKRDYDYAVRQGIIKEPPGKNQVPDVPLQRHAEMLPAGDIKSGWRLHVESKTSSVRRMR